MKKPKKSGHKKRPYKKPLNKKIKTKKRKISRLKPIAQMRMEIAAIDMRKGMSLEASAKDAGIEPKRLLRHLQYADAIVKKDGHWVLRKDRVRRWT